MFSSLTLIPFYYLCAIIRWRTVPDKGLKTFLEELNVAAYNRYDLPEQNSAGRQGAVFHGPGTNEKGSALKKTRQGIHSGKQERE
jgi:hypothetical protein